MDKKELLEKALTQESTFSDHKLENLLILGEFIGRNIIFFKDLYKGYKNKSEFVEFKASIGAKVTTVFDWESGSVKISRVNIEVDLTIDSFLRFMNLIDTCFLEIIPIASVVDLNLDFMDDQVKEAMSKSKIGTLVVISGRKISLEKEMDDFVVDYIGRLWPFGETSYTPPILLSNVMIKNVVHRGLVNDTEKELANRYRKDLIEQKKRSPTFVSESELSEIKERVEKNNELEERKEGELIE